MFKPSANCACAILLIGGLGYLYRGLLLVARGELENGLATVVDSVRESIHAIRCDFLCPKGTQSESGSGRSKPSGILHIGFFACFSLFFQARVVMNPLVSLIGRLVACSARISVDSTHTPTTVKGSKVLFDNVLCTTYQCLP